jgi:hypothetical protein
MTHRRGVITTPKIALVFYRTTGGAEPVRDWLKSLDRDDRLAIGGDLQRVQYRWPVGMPLCRAMQGGLWEVRTNLPSRTTARVLICFFMTGFSTPCMASSRRQRRRRTMS